MPQNILVDLMDGEPPSLIDWSMAAVGDPAYDLAIAIGPGKHPFKRRNGLRRLLEAYHAAGGDRLQPENVQLHQLCIRASWFKAALEPDGITPAAENELLAFAGLYRHASG